MLLDNEDKTICEECGKSINIGERIISQASGTMGELGPELGDHFIMHEECPE